MKGCLYAIGICFFLMLIWMLTLPDTEKPSDTEKPVQPTLYKDREPYKKYIEGVQQRKQVVAEKAKSFKPSPVVKSVLTRDEKRFFWATLNVNGVVLAPDSELMWSVRFLAEQNMSDPEFQRFMLKIRRYKNFVIKHPDKVTPPAWAKDKIK